MRLTLRQLRQIIWNALQETYEQTPGTKSLPDDMNRIVSYGKDLGLDDEENPQKHEVQIHKPGNVKPTVMLGHGHEDDPENSFEDPMAEIFQPGFQEFQRTMDFSYEDMDTPKRHNDEANAWQRCQELYDTVKDKWGLRSMSDPTFIDFALDELMKDGTPDGIVTRMRFRLENENENGG